VISGVVYQFYVYVSSIFWYVYSCCLCSSEMPVSLVIVVSYYLHFNQ